jgi:hypothetical protein
MMKIQRTQIGQTVFIEQYHSIKHLFFEPSSTWVNDTAGNIFLCFKSIISEFHTTATSTTASTASTTREWKCVEKQLDKSKRIASATTSIIVRWWWPI